MKNNAPHSHTHQRSDLVRISQRAMTERGLLPEFSDAVLHQLASLPTPSFVPSEQLADLRSLLWCSIDNDDSRDLDQLTVAEPLADGGLRLRVAIADVDSLVQKDTPIDDHAKANTATVYTSARIFPMLPEVLSTDLTSLNPGQTRLALVTEMDFQADGTLVRSTVQRALVFNRAQLSYDSVSAWLDGNGDLPHAASLVPGMDEQLRMQDAMAQQLRARRYEQGSLEFQTFAPRVVFDDDRVKAIELQVHNRARQLIEEVMIATNGCTARYLAQHQRDALRRVVRTPERWAQIVAVASTYGESLPAEPNSEALEAFLARQRRTDPLRFPDLSLVVIKLMGSGEYVVESPTAEPIGHFGLAVKDYAHSTAPNRRYPDLITQRLLKAAMAGRPSPYGREELAALARHCTQQEDAVRKVERRMRKSEAALYLESMVGQIFQGLVTGTAPDGVWVRVLAPPVEGHLQLAEHLMEIGQKVRLQLVSVSVEKGYIDFVLAEGP